MRERPEREEPEADKPKTVRTEGIAREVVLDGKKLYYESLILAQDERWRRA